MRLGCITRSRIARNQVHKKVDGIQGDKKMHSEGYIKEALDDYTPDKKNSDITHVVLFTKNSPCANCRDNYVNKIAEWCGTWYPGATKILGYSQDYGDTLPAGWTAEKVDWG